MRSCLLAAAAVPGRHARGGYQRDCSRRQQDALRQPHEPGGPQEDRNGSEPDVSGLAEQACHGTLCAMHETRALLHVTMPCTKSGPCCMRRCFRLSTPKLTAWDHA
eukprot:357859-Chlamydomonas_euryale.AAC.13